MKKQVSQIISEAGILLSLMTELDKRVRARGGGFEDWHRLVKSEGEPILDQIAYQIMRGEYKGAHLVSIKPADLDSLISRGYFYNVHPDITAGNFPLDSSQFGDFRMELVPVGRVFAHRFENLDAFVGGPHGIQSSEILDYLEWKKLEPAKIGHLLGFRAKYYDLRLEFPICALGSCLEPPFRGVPCIDGVATQRRLALDYRKHGWSKNWRVLAIHKGKK